MAHFWELKTEHKSKSMPFSFLLTEANGIFQNPQVQILRTGKFKHPVYGEFEITPQILAEMKANFESNVRGIDIAFDYFHKSEEEAAGWPRTLELRENGNELWASNIEWTPTAKKKISEKELRYFSPDFGFQWTDPESGITHRNVLFGGGLTNRPFVKGMEPIVTLSEAMALADDADMKACVANLIPDLMKEGHSQEQAIAIAYSKCGEKKMADASACVPDVKLGFGTNVQQQKEGDTMDAKDQMIAELQAKVKELEAKLQSKGEMPMAEQKKMEEMKAAVALSEEALKKSNERITALEGEARTVKQKAAFQVLLSEGKACAAQEEAFMKGDMAEFAAKAQPLNLSERGNGGAPGVTGESAEEKILKLAEEKKLPVREILAQNPELARQYREGK